MAIYEKMMGNPFVDAGVSAICEWLEGSVQPEQITTDDLEGIVMEVVPIMRPFDKKEPDAHGWKNWVSIFTTNHALTHPSKKGDRAANFQEELLNHIANTEPLIHSGDCIGCGRRDANTWLSRTGVPLTGSGALLNFFPTFAEGVGYCAACALAIQLSPFVFVASAGKFLVMHSNSWSALRSWARICVADVRQQVIRREISGCYNRGYANPRNSLFYMTGEMISHGETRLNENITLEIYCFSNFGQSPELEIFHLPAPVFRFLRYAYQSDFRKAWQQIVRSGYQWVKWDKVESEEDYKNHTNLVYEYLLQGQSILGFFINRRARKARSNWELLSLYLKEVRNMNESRLTAIKQVGDAIADSIRKSERARRLRQLETAGNYAECRNVLRFVIRDRIQQGEQEPLFSIDDYIEHLFPASADQTTFWRETRDLLVFRIYEKLHDWLVASGFADDIDDETDQSTDESQEEK